MIQVEHLSLSFGSREVLRDFSPEERKEFFSYLKRMQKTLLEDISKT